MGTPVAAHVYLIDGPNGPISFDAGVRGSGEAVLAVAGDRLDRVILSHSHADHRGGAAELRAPVYCHPDEVSDAEGDGGRRYTDFRLVEDERIRELLPRLQEAWDGGPVTIAGTVEEDEEVAGFRIVHTPGHAPGQIALFRESDRLLLAADAVFTLDGETGQPAPPRVAHPFSNWDTKAARQSILRLTSLRPSAIWLGHGEPIIGDDIAAQLERASP
jgi:glyoxylase-like metal-dependent hydrolase (beta-lactamase superfamily II)